MDLTNSQNFLKSPTLVAELINRSNITSDDTVVDIGAGKGIITRHLAKVCKHVISVEKDPSLFDMLKKEFEQNQKVELICNNILSVRLPKYPYKVFSNIPFDKTSEIFFKLFFEEARPKEAFLVMQKEAALRFMGQGEGTLLSLLLKPFYDLKISYDFSTSDFYPEPSVDSVLLQVTELEKPLLDLSFLGDYRDFISYVVNQQKPTLKLRLNKILTSTQFYKLIRSLSISETANTKDVTLNQWLSLFKYYYTGVDYSKKMLVKGSFDKFRHSRENQDKVTRTKIKFSRH